MAIASTKGNLSFKVLPDEIRKRFNGEMSYQAFDTGDKWIYKKHRVTHSVADILATTDEFLGITSSNALALDDKVRFIMLRHTGFGDLDEVQKVVFGILIVFDAGTPAFDTRAAQGSSLFLAPGESMVLKTSAAEVRDFHAVTCRITSGIPSANGSSGDNAVLEIAAVIDDIA